MFGSGPNNAQTTEINRLLFNSAVPVKRNKNQTLVKCRGF